MRLINIDTMMMEEFVKAPPYCILSHRWGSVADEIKFEQFMELNEAQRAQLKTPKSFDRLKTPGLFKIAWACSIIRTDESRWGGAKHFWIDTCCIDKRNALELGQSLNSMFRWYQRAEACIVYLNDVPEDPKTTRRTAFEESAWFQRGWTLQELLAPSKAVFFDQVGTELGDRVSLSSALSIRTGIDENYLQGVEDFSNACIAKKMSWLSQRTTSVRDDMAYCALGLFDVSMDIRYGEEERAFQRLQERLLEYNDLSLFAWTLPERLEGSSFGLFAPWPSCFSGAGNFTIQSKHREPQVPPRMANFGVHMCVPMKVPFSLAWRGLVKNKELSINVFLDKSRLGPSTATKRTVTLVFEKNGDGIWRRTDLTKYKYKSSANKTFYADQKPLVMFIHVPNKCAGEGSWVQGLIEKAETRATR